jgi:hypothetical protein
VQEVQQVVGILARGIEADEELHRSVPLGDLLQALQQLRVAGGRFGKGQLCLRRLLLVAEEASVVAVA